MVFNEYHVRRQRALSRTLQEIGCPHKLVQVLPPEVFQRALRAQHTSVSGI